MNSARQLLGMVERLARAGEWKELEEELDASEVLDSLRRCIGGEGLVKLFELGAYPRILYRLAGEESLSNSSEAIAALAEAAVESCLVNQRSSQLILSFLEFGMDPNIYFSNGRTLLHNAALKGCLELVANLLDYGADPDLVEMNSTGSLSPRQEFLGSETELAALIHRANRVRQRGRD